MSIDAMKQAREALDLGRGAVYTEILRLQQAYAGYPHRWAIEQEDLAAIDEAITVLKEKE
jgi:hypothetical protein